MAQEPCPLCGRDAEVRSFPNQSLFRVWCGACGQYVISETVIQDRLINRLREIGRPEEIHLLSALTRQASDRGQPITITWENIPTLLELVPRLTIPDQMERALICLANLQKRADQYLEGVEFATNYTLAFARDEAEFNYFVENLIEQGLLHGTIRACRLSPEGWSKVEQLRKSQPDSDQAFVAMWFADELKPAYLEGLEPALKSVGYNAWRADFAEHNDRIDDRIVAEIRRSALLVADLTGNRGGVYFEAGFALGLGIPVIWTCQKTDIEKVHFDAEHYNFILWTTHEELKERLQNRIAATIPGRVVKR